MEAWLMWPRISGSKALDLPVYLRDTCLRWHDQLRMEAGRVTQCVVRLGGGTHKLSVGVPARQRGGHRAPGSDSLALAEMLNCT